MAFQGFNNCPGPTTPPKFNIRFGVRNDHHTPPPSTSAAPAAQSRFLIQSPPPPPQSFFSPSASPSVSKLRQPPAFSFGVTVPGDASFLNFGKRNISKGKDLPPKEEDRQQNTNAGQADDASSSSLNWT